MEFNCVLPKFVGLSLNSHLEIVLLWKLLKLNKIIYGSDPVRLVSSEEQEERPKFPLPPLAHKEDRHMSPQQKVATTCRPERGASPELNQVGPLISDFQPAEL